jgi:sporulation protein YlmC with PRC-barrel domain
MRTLLLSTAIAALALPALGREGTPFRESLAATELRASDFIGMRLYASEAPIATADVAGLPPGWEDIGEVNDIVIDREGRVQAVLVDIGGFLGIGERRVAVNMEALRFVADSATAADADDFFLVINADRAALENAPAYDGTRGAEQAAAATDAAIAEGAEALVEGAAAAGAAAGAAAAGAVGGAEAAGAAVGDGAATAMTQTEEAADEAMAAAAGGTAAGMAREPIRREGFVAAGADHLSSERLQGAPVFDARDERVGEVGELLLSEDGQVEAIVVDVGGFLGIGQKPVALALEQVDILREEAGAAIRVYVSLTREELDAMERFQAN